MNRVLRQVEIDGRLAVGHLDDAFAAFANSAAFTENLEHRPFGRTESRRRCGD